MPENTVVLGKEDIDLVLQKKQEGKLNLKRILAVSKMRIPNTGHLEHFDEELPYIAYVKFEEGGMNNRAFKPVEFYSLLRDNIGNVRMI
jgi:hypothetical protein